MITVEQFAAAVKCSLAIAKRWYEPMKAAMAFHDITTPKRIAAFLAQLAHESAHLTRTAESFNYTPDAILATFNTKANIRFTPAQAFRYGRTKEHPADQKMIANIAYAHRMGNGSIESGDGHYYRGRGPIQLTGKRNYIVCGKAIGVDLQANPALAERPDIGSMVACWFWTEGNPTGKSLNLLADKGDIRGISRAINGGNNGMDDRIALTSSALQVFA